MINTQEQSPGYLPRHSRRDFLRWSGQLAAGTVFTTVIPSLSVQSAEPPPGGMYASFGSPVWPPFEKIETLLRYWKRKYAGLITVETVARTAQGRAVYAIILTDPKTEDSEKEHVLITALHSGLERSASTSALHIVEWLLSRDRLAREILRRQIVVCMPVPDPDRYEAGQVSPVYNAWTLDGPRDPGQLPEAVAVQQIMDRYQPEVHADIHGVSLGFERYIMFENSGSSYSNTALRPYHREIIRQMDEAALAEGFPSDMAESDGERLFWGPNLEPIKEKLWRGRPQAYAAIYCYNRYHTIVSASEVAWERSGLLRHRRLMEIGNETWPGEYYAGYPARIIMSNTHAVIGAYGENAATRRQSRIELWNKQDQLTFGILDPVVEGKSFCVCATTPASAKKWLSAGSLKDWLQNLRGNNAMNIGNIERFTDGWPAGQNNPQPFLFLQGGAAGSSAAGRTDDAVIRHGLCMRLRLPYGKARLRELNLNGCPLQVSEVDGYVKWNARACTFIQINLSPERLKKDGLFVVTCDYDPCEKRKRWDTWRLTGNV